MFDKDFREIEYFVNCYETIEGIHAIIILLQNFQRVRLLLI